MNNPQKHQKGKMCASCAVAIETKLTLKRCIEMKTCAIGFSPEKTRVSFNLGRFRP